MNQSAVSPRLDLVGGRPGTTSLNVAEVFGKQHSIVMRAIRSLDVPDDFNRCNFALVACIDSKGKPRPMYQITRDGFTLLAMGFTGKQAMQFKLAYIAVFNAMERQLGGAPVAGKRADIFHHRGPVTDCGLDIRFQLDLTKIVQHPTPQSLSVLQKLTGVDVSELIDELHLECEVVGDDAQSMAVMQFIEACTRPAKGHRQPLAELARAFNTWQQGLGSKAPSIRWRGLAKILRHSDIELRKLGSVVYALHVQLLEVA